MTRFSDRTAVHAKRDHFGESKSSVSDPNESEAESESALSFRGGSSRADLVLTVIGWLGLALLVVVTVLPGLFGAKVFLGTDVLPSFHPWKSVADSVGGATNGGIGDTIDSVAPSSNLIVTALETTGSLPQWDPYNNGGTPLGALPNSAVFSPLSLPWWILPASAAPAGVKLLEIAAVGLGMYLLLRRRWKLPNFTIPLATIIFVTSGFMVAWTNWPQTRVAAMIPLLFWATDRLATNHRWVDSIPMALVFASMLLGGFPAVTAYAMYSAVAYFVVRVIATRVPLRTALMSLLRSAVGAILGIGLSAFQILPFAWFATHNVDFEARSGFRGWHLPFETLSTSVVPYLLGFPNGTNNSWPVHFIEGFSYIGACTLVLVVVGLLVRPRRAFPKGVMPFFAALLIVLGGAAYLGGPLLSAIQLLPAMSTSPIGRIRAVIGFAAAILGALGGASLFNSASLRQQLQALRPLSLRTLSPAILRLGAALAISLPILISVREAMHSDWPQLSRTWVLVALLIISTAAVAAAFVWISPSRATASLAVALALVATTIPAIDVVQKWWPLADASTFYPETPTHSFLERNLGQDRYVSVGQTLLPGTSTYYRLRALNGHAFTYPAWHELLETVDGEYFRTPTYTALTPDSVQTSVYSPVLDRLGVKYVVQAPGSSIDGTIDPAAETVGDATLSSGSPALTTGQFNGKAVGVRLRVLAQDGLPESPAIVKATAVSSEGEELAGRDLLMEGVASDFDILLALGDLSENDAWHVELELGGSPATITFATEANGDIVASPIRSVDNSLDVVHTGDSTILRRNTSLERVRWANSSVVEADADARLALLTSDELPATTVVLEHASDRAPDSESSATVDIEETGTDAVAATVTSDGPGWVVIADPLRGEGWSATVDGQPAELVDADHAVVAVRITEAGTHEVVLKYESPLFKAGTAVSIVTALALLACGVAMAFTTKSRRNRRANMKRNDEPASEPQASLQVVDLGDPCAEP